MDRRQALQDFLQFCQSTNQHPLGFTVADLPQRLADYVEDDPYSDSAQAYQAATETEKAQLYQAFWDYLPALREREAKGYHFLRVPFREAAGPKGEAPMTEEIDRLGRTLELMRRNPHITDEELAQELGMIRPASARFWRLKAFEMLKNEPIVYVPKQQKEATMEQQQQPLVFVDQHGREHESSLTQEQYEELQNREAHQAAERLRERVERANQPGFFARLASSLFGQRNNDDGPTSGAMVPAAPSSPSGGPTKTTSVMTQEELRVRRMNLVESARHGRPFHESAMLFFLRIWLFLGPIAFVALTTSEVAYILTSLVAPGDNGTYIIWGGALFIDLAMMFTTFGVAIKRRDLAEKREVNGSVSKREEMEVTFGTFMWLIFALINGISQSAFLLHIIAASRNANMNTLYVFVASRVVGFLLGDAVTAFFLSKVDNSALKLIARGEREKAALYRDIAQAEGERQMVEAKAEADISLLQIKVQQEREDAEFLANLKRQIFTDILSRRGGPPARVEDSQKGARVLGSGPRS